MYASCQIFSILAIIYSLHSVLCAPNFYESDNCDCDVLQINDPRLGSNGNQNFTKQNDTLNGKPYFFSTQQNIISWKGKYWTYDIYNDHLNMSMLIQSYRSKHFSFDKNCTNVTWKTSWNYQHTFVKTQCLKEKSNYCSGTKEITRNITNGIQNEQVKLQAKNPCKFPFIYKNITYKSCINRTQVKLWCATTVDDKNQLTSWGYCSDLCPLEDNMLKVDETSVAAKEV